MPLKHEFGWSIWTFTDLDWVIIGGMYEKGYTNNRENLEDSQPERLLAECSGDGIYFFNEIYVWILGFHFDYGIRNGVKVIIASREIYCKNL
jgi:hypothetical protein